MKFLKFLKASGLGSSRASGLLNSRSLLGVLAPSNALGRLLFIRVWRWVSDMWQSLIGDTCHNLIGPLMSLLTRVGLHMLSLTRIRLLMSSLTCADVWLVFACILCLYFNDTWQIFVGFWVVIVKPSSSMWRFVIGCILWTW